jgi:hypothetical protein
VPGCGESCSSAPTSAARTAISGLHVLLDEEWAYRRFATRDLAFMDADPAD